VLLVGDSVAGSLGLGFDTVGPSANLVVWDRGRLGCGLLTDGEILEGGELLPIDPGCDWHQVWQSNVDEFQPDVVLMLVGAWDVPDHQVKGQWLRVGTVEYDRYFLSELDKATALLASRGAKVVVLTSPFFSRPELVGETGRQWPEYDPWRVDRINALYRDFAVSHPDRFTVVDLNRFVSPHGKFTDDLNGVQIRGDGVHFTQDGAVMVDRWLAPQLTAIADGHPEAADTTKHYDSRGLWAR
jgi:hypothetical protein